MKRLLVKLFIVGGIGITLLVVAGPMLFAPASRSAIEQGTTYALGVDAQLGKVDASVGFENSHLGLVGFDVQNPQGFGGDPFLHIGELSVDIQTMSVVSDTISVPTITLHGLHLRLVQDAERSNFKEILDHLSSLSSDTPDEAPETVSEESGAPGPSLSVGIIDLRDIQLTVEIAGIPGFGVDETFTAGDLRIDVPQLVRDAESMTLARVIGLLIDQLVEHGITEAGGHISPEALELLTGGFAAIEARLEAKVDEKLDALEGQAEDALQEQQDQAKTELDASIEKEKQKLGGALKGLLGDG
ncbi:MAG: hypothetical protein ACI8QZ_002599 [Chlamydiales bacterium]|jgi:hypothetical protein